MEDEKRELQENSARKRVAGGVGDDYDVLANSSDASSLPGAASKAKASSLKARENVSDEEKIDEMVLPKAEVIRRNCANGRSTADWNLRTRRKMQRLRRAETRMAVGVENRMSMVMGASHPVSTTTRT
ncbi:unnamed protein product [Sphagnum troendelagicum]|uniref:Uncharacterized protein n=1 Tax=Sphagnum jensenii TaxID=128206 RepID=A0ABP0WEQ8_9BRYO